MKISEEFKKHLAEWMQPHHKGTPTLGQIERAARLLADSRPDMARLITHGERDELDELYLPGVIEKLAEREPRLFQRTPSASEVVAAETSARAAQGLPCGPDWRMTRARELQGLDGDALLDALPAGVILVPQLAPEPQSTRNNDMSLDELDAKVEKTFGYAPGTLMPSKLNALRAAIRDRDGKAPRAPSSTMERAVESGVVDASKLSPEQRIRLFREQQASERNR